MDEISAVKKEDLSENIYRKYFEEMPCFVSIQDRDMKIVGCNRLCRESFGGKAGEYCYEVYKGRMQKCDSCPVEETFLTGKPQQSEEMVKTLKGEEIPVYVYTTPIFNEKGAVEQVLEISSDISIVKNMQKKLHKTQKELQQFFDEVPCYLTIQDRDLFITSANRKFRDDFGSWTGSHCYETYKHRDEPCLESASK